MNNCSSSRHLPLILIWKESTRPFTALNKNHEQTLNYKKIVTSFSSSRFDRTLTDCVQSKNSRNRVKLDEILSTIKNILTDQVKFNTGTQFICGKKSLQCKLVYVYLIASTTLSKFYVH